MREVLAATYGAEATPSATFDWWSFGCPDATSGFMLAEVAGRVVGVQPLEVFPFTNDGEQLKGGLLTGVAVHPDFRRQGIFSALVKACEQEAWKQGADFVTTMPNERSRPGFLKLGYVDPGRRRLLVRPLAPRALSQGALRLPLLGSTVGWVAELGQALLKPGPQPSGSSVREIGGIPEDVEELNEAHARLFPGLRMQRSRAWWRWRYEQSPLRRYRFFEARDVGQKSSGVAVVTFETRDKVPVAYLMDVVVRDSGVLSELLGQVFAAAREGGAHVICAVASSSKMVRALRRAGFWLVPQWAPVKRFYTVVRFNPEREARLPVSWRQIGNWYQMLGDWDNL